MAEDPAARYPTARVLADELDQWLRWQQTSDRRLWFIRIYLAIGLAAAFVDRDRGSDGSVPLDCSERPRPARSRPIQRTSLRHPAASVASAVCEPIRCRPCHVEARLARADHHGQESKVRLIGNRETRLYHRAHASRSNRWPNAIDTFWRVRSRPTKKASGHVTNAIHRSSTPPGRSTQIGSASTAKDVGRAHARSSAAGVDRESGRADTEIVRSSFVILRGELAASDSRSLGLG